MIKYLICGIVIGLIVGILIGATIFEIAVRRVENGRK